MTKKVKLSKRGLSVIILAFLAVILIIAAIFYVTKTSKQPDSSENVAVKETVSNLVVENQILKVQLLDYVNDRNYQEDYQEVALAVEKDEEVLGYLMEDDQTFIKVMQLLPPDDNSPLLNHNSEKPSHEAYILVLTGDIVEYQNQAGESFYRIVNGQLSYYKQSLLLESDYDSVYIASIDGSKEKMVQVEEYQKALSSPETFMTMLQW